MRRSDLRPLLFAVTLIVLLFASLAAVAAGGHVEETVVRKSWAVKTRETCAPRGERAAHGSRPEAGT